MRTGDISYDIGISVPATTGSWSVSLGFLDQNESVWNISGVSGKIYDTSGYMVGGYNSNVTTTLQGVISGGDHSLYQDGVLLSNTQHQEEADYNMVSISGDYMGDYFPAVEIFGDQVLNDSDVQTVPFWKKGNDDQVLFVTENDTGDLGFIRALSGMGFSVEPSLLTGAGIIEADEIEETYGLVIFGSATSSGLYTDGVWNSVKLPMMSLNNHLVCSENLNWYSDVSSESLGNEIGAVFPGRYFAEEGANDLWAEFPTKGWERLVQDGGGYTLSGPLAGDTFTGVSYYVPYGKYPYYSQKNNPSGSAYYYPSGPDSEWEYLNFHVELPANQQIWASAVNGIQHDQGDWVTYTDGGYQKIDGENFDAVDRVSCWKSGDYVTITWPGGAGTPWSAGISAEIYDIGTGGPTVDIFYRFSTSHGVPPTSYDITVEPSESCKCAIWDTGDLMTVEFGDGSKIDGQVTYKDPSDGLNCSINFVLNEVAVATEGTGISVYKRTPPKYASFETSGSHTIVRLVDNMSGATPYSGSGIFDGAVDPTGFSNGLQSDLGIEFTGIDGAPAIVTTVLSNTLGGTGEPSFSLTGSTWGLDQVHFSGRVIPQRASYNVDNLYRRTTLTSGLYPADEFNMYTGGVSTTDGFGGDIFVVNTDSGKLITVWHKGFWTGGYSGAPYIGGFAENELMSFSVTPTGSDWATGYNMWDTLTKTGQQLFVNAVAGFFID